jgi:hypothetical protein
MFLLADGVQGQCVNKMYIIYVLPVILTTDRSTFTKKKIKCVDQIKTNNCTYKFYTLLCCTPTPI